MTEAVADHDWVLPALAVAATGLAPVAVRLVRRPGGRGSGAVGPRHPLRTLALLEKVVLVTGRGVARRVVPARGPLLLLPLLLLLTLIVTMHERHRSIGAGPSRRPAPGARPAAG